MEQNKTVREIVKEYRHLAAEAESVADCPIPRPYQQAYRTMARHWIELANELESTSGTGTLH